MSNWLAEAWRLTFWWIVVPVGVLLALLTLAALFFNIFDAIDREQKK